MKGMHGVCLHPGRAYLELKVRAYNRTPFAQTFLWWANVATRVHEAYQSFFPPDVYYVADHARRSMSEYPLARGHYYGVNYGERGRQGRAGTRSAGQFRAAARPARSHASEVGFELPDYAPNDLSFYANIPVPTSYMCMGSQEDFFGGYDHRAQAGIVHVANHHISPGKKQWTWGNHEFGYAWDRNLTDADAAGEFAPLHRDHGRRLHRQPARFQLPSARRNQDVEPVSGIRSRRSVPAQHANLEAAVVAAGFDAPASKAPPRRCGHRRFRKARLSLAARGRTAPLPPDRSRAGQAVRRRSRAAARPEGNRSAAPRDRSRRPRDHLLSARSRAANGEVPPPGHRTARAARHRQRRRALSSPACTWSNIATPRAARRSTGARRCAAIRWTRAATTRWASGICGAASSRRRKRISARPSSV